MAFASQVPKSGIGNTTGGRLKARCEMSAHVFLSHEPAYLRESEKGFIGGLGRAFRLKDKTHGGRTFILCWLGEEP